MPASKAKVPEAVTRKVGPAPVWVWVAIAAVGYYVFAHRGTTAAAAVQPSPNVQSTGNAAGGDAGLGNPSGNLSADLLQMLGQGVFGIHDAYNSSTYSTVDSHDYSTTTTTTYGGGYGGPTYGGGYGGPTPSPGSEPTPPGGGGGTVGGGGGGGSGTGGGGGGTTSGGLAPVPIDYIIPKSTLTPPSFFPSPLRYGGVASP